GGGVRDERPERALVAVGLLPVKAVLLARRAAEALRVVSEPRVVLNLGVDELAARRDRRELVPANAPVEQLLLARGGIEEPTVAVTRERDRERPVVLAEMDDRHRAVVGLLDPRLLARCGEEALAGRLVGDRVTGRDDVVAPGTEDGFDAIGLLFA